MLNKKILLLLLILNIAYSDTYQYSGDDGINIADSENIYVDKSKQYYEVKNSELYLSLQSENSTEYSSGVKRSRLDYAIERVIVQANYTDDFYENTHRRQESGYQSVSKLGGDYSFNVFNNSNQDIEGIKLEIFFPTEIRFLLMAPPLDNIFKYDTGYNPSTGLAELRLENPALILRAKKVTKIPLAMVALSFPPRKKEYKIEYKIGSEQSNYQTIKRNVVFSIQTKDVPLMYIYNYNGLKYMYETDELLKAINSFKNAIDNAPNNAAFNFNLCTAYLMNREYKKALSPCQKAYKKRNNEDYFVVGQLAAVYQRLDNYPKSIPYLLEALDLKQNSEIDLRNLNYSLEHIKNKEDLVNTLSKRKKELLLIFSSFLGKEEYVSILLKGKININAHTISGMTALHNAVGSGNMSIVKRLMLNRNIDITIKDKAGYSITEIAKERGHQDIVKWIKIINEI